MRYLLDFAYLVLLLLLAPWLAWRALRTGRYRQGWGAKLLGQVPLRQGDHRCIWLHAVSVGEVQLLHPLVEALAEAFPQVELVVSTTTRAGYELACKRYAGRKVFYCPLDFSWAVGRALRRLRPDLLILAELELWPNLIAAACERGTRVAVVNGRLGERSFRGYRRLRPLVAPMFGRLDLVAAQTETYARRFRDLGAPRVVVTGSLKFDGAQTDRDNPATAALRRLARLAPGEPVFLAGSTQPPEEQLALAAWRKAAARHPGLRLIVVPRHPERFDQVAEMLQAQQVRFARRSRLGSSAGEPPPVLLVDAVGELRAWWGLADVAFVGGSLVSHRGGQNMIEAAAYGAAVAFGPHTFNFRDVVEALLAADAACVVQNGQELADFVVHCLNQPEGARLLGSRAQALVVSQRGATRRTIQWLAPLLPAEAPPRERKAA